MKWLGNIAVCLASGLAVNASLAADDLAMVNTASPGNPYSVIAVRNIFGLVPPPPPAPAEPQDNKLPKITLTGIQHFPGMSLQALFKVSPKPGSSGKDQYYTLNSGERQDDIEVVKIDDVKNVVTFDNSGTTQEIPLAEAKATGPAGGGAPAAAAGMNPAVAAALAARAAAGGGGGIIQFGAQQGGPNITTANGATKFNDSAAPPGLNPATSANSLQSHIYQPPAPQVSPEAEIITIEANRAALMNNPNPPYSPNLLPPTELTKFNTPGGGANNGQ